MESKKGLDFKHKEVINMKNAKRLGYVQDVTADFDTGRIKEIIVPGNTKFFNLFTTGNEVIIPWSSIRVIGDDIILVEI